MMNLVKTVSLNNIEIDNTNLFQKKSRTNLALELIDHTYKSTTLFHKIYHFDPQREKHLEFVMKLNGKIIIKYFILTKE